MGAEDNVLEDDTLVETGPEVDPYPTPLFPNARDFARLVEEELRDGLLDDIPSEEHDTEEMLAEHVFGVSGVDTQTATLLKMRESQQVTSTFEKSSAPDPLGIPRKTKPVVAKRQNDSDLDTSKRTKLPAQTSEAKVKRRVRSAEQGVKTELKPDSQAGTDKYPNQDPRVLKWESYLDSGREDTAGAQVGPRFPRRGSKDRKLEQEDDAQKGFGPNRNERMQSAAAKGTPGGIAKVLSGNPVGSELDLMAAVGEIVDTDASRIPRRISSGGVRLATIESQLADQYEDGLDDGTEELPIRRSIRHREECRMCGKHVARPHARKFRGSVHSKHGFQCDRCENTFCAAHVQRSSSIFKSIFSSASFRCLLCAIEPEGE